MKETFISINEALIIQISALGIGDKSVPRSDLIRANQLLKKVGKLTDYKIEMKDDGKSSDKKRKPRT